MGDGILGLYLTYVAWRLRVVEKRRMAFDPEVQLLLCRKDSGSLSYAIRLA